MLDAARRQGGEAFNPSGQRHQPSRQLLGGFQPLMREVVARAEKHHAPLAFVDAELERRQGKGADVADERCFFLRADEVRLVVQPLGPRAVIGERGKPLATRMARFGINLASSGGKRRPPLLNARTDSLRRGSFKTMLANKRCVIPAEGFYEWREEHGKKQPYFFARKDGRPVMFAGIWDYSDIKGEAVPSFAILTDEPNELVAPYHDRMPVVLGDVERWLNLDTTLDDVDPLGPERFAVRAVNPAVNKVSEKNINAIERAA